jgi:hypothetical protein
MPWIRRRVLISKEGHPLKGKHAVILSVLPRQATPSGLKIEVELTDYDPNAPYRKEFFDYDDLKDARYDLTVMFLHRHLTDLYQVQDRVIYLTSCCPLQTKPSCWTLSVHANNAKYSEPILTHTHAS